MKQEKFKSIVLLMLVCLSLLLTYQLWYGQQPVELTADDENIYERIIIEQPRPPEQIVSPEVIVIPAENGFYAFREGEQFYYRLWESLLGLMESPFVREQVEEPVTDLPEEAPLILRCYLSPLLPVGTKLSLMPLLPAGEIAMLDLIAGKETFWIRFYTADEKIFAEREITTAQTAVLKDLIAGVEEEGRVTHKLLTGEAAASASGENITVTRQIFLPQEQTMLARLPVKPESIDREQLLKTFFVDYSLVRTIEEKDGAVIYTDGEKGLRLTAGGFEYSHPRLEEGVSNQSVPEALNNSGILISFHGGWPVGLRLEKIAQSPLGHSVPYIAQWRMYHEGNPLYTAKPTRAVFNDRGLIHFSRFIYSIQPEEQNSAEMRVNASWQEALKTAIALYRDDTGAQTEVMQLELEAFNLGYAIIADFDELWAEPVWQLQINGRRVLLRADNLVQLKEEDIK